MKLLLCFILFSVLNVSGSIFSQSTTFDLAVNGKTVKEVFKDIESQSQYRFLYNDDFPGLNRLVTLSSYNLTINEALDELFEGANLTYRELENNLIVITPAELFLQDGHKVVGIITDAGGDPLPGANVIIEGTTIGAVTNVDGNYSIVTDPNNTLVFSFIGYESQRIPINGRSEINITLSPTIEQLDEVIAIGYGTQRRRDLTGSVIQADQEMIQDHYGTSVVQSLHGTVPGLNIGQINQAGQEPSLSIRGQTSLAGVGAPLIVVDDVIFRGNLIDLNPHDIESINVLKDASSVAIYGSQAANGVVMITTMRSGREEGITLDYNSSYSFDSPAHSIGLESPEEYLARIRNYDVFDSRTAESGYLEPKPDYDISQLLRTTEQIEAYRNNNPTDWANVVLNERMYSHNHNLSFSNRSENSRYYVSLGYTDVVGYAVNDEYSRWNARFNLDNSITDWFDIGVQSFMTTSDYSGESAHSQAYILPPFAPAFREDGSYTTNPRGVGADINPYYTVYETDDLNKRLNLFGNLYANISVPFIEGLSFRTNYSTNYRKSDRHYFRPWDSNFQGSGQKREGLFNDWSQDNILNYLNTFGRVHRVDLTLGYGREKREYSYSRAYSEIFSRHELGYNRLQIGSADMHAVESGGWVETSLYNFARFFYGYDNKYLLTGTIRRDGFSGFSEENKFGLFPSIATAWTITEEDFMNINWLNFLKIRVSYGSSGNRTIGRYDIVAKLDGGYRIIDGDKRSLYAHGITSMASPNLKWETTTGYNFGFDFVLLDNRIEGSIDYYNNNTTDLLYEVDIPGISRFEVFPDNLGKIHNQGLEINANSINVSTEDFQWTSSFTFSRNRNELKELLGFDTTGDGKEDDLVAEGLFIGESIDAIYTYVNTGNLWQLDDYFEDRIPSYGDYGTYILEDLNGDGEITPDDRTIIGYSSPSYRFSVGNRFKYKNWSLYVFLNSVQGGSNYYLGLDDLSAMNDFGGTMELNRTWATNLDVWLPENPNATYQRQGVHNVPAQFRQTRHTSRSFIRLQDLRLSYNFDREFLTRVNLNSLRVYFHGSNLFTWTDWPGWDPETGDRINMYGRPITKSYSFGVDIKF
jgi:TonB-dependent starch-binding outer membrane protein SusC